MLIDNIQTECNLMAFNHSNSIKCTEYVFKDNEHRLSKEVGAFLFCYDVIVRSH